MTMRILAVFLTALLCMSNAFAQTAKKPETAASAPVEAAAAPAAGTPEKAADDIKPAPPPKLKLKGNTVVDATTGEPLGVLPQQKKVVKTLPFTVFTTVEACDAARQAGRANAYKPLTNAPFKGGEGWTKKAVPSGGACLGGAYVLEDGVPHRSRAVFVPEGFAYWEHTSGAYRMHDCSNPFEMIQLAAAPAPTPTTVVPAPQNTVVQITETIQKDIVLKETVYCVMPSGTKVLASIQDGQPVCPEVKITAPVVVDEPIRVRPRIVRARPSAINTPASSCSGDCAPQPAATVQREEKAKVCGIAVQKSLSDKTIVARLQLDENPDHPGALRIASVSSFEGVPSMVSRSPWRHSATKDCNEDQATVYQHWPEVVKKFNLPLDCIPTRLRS